jgi:hypothetical protein
MHPREDDIAAQYDLTLRRQSGAQRIGKRTDGRDHHHTERETGDENPETVETVA